MVKYDQTHSTRRVKGKFKKRSKAVAPLVSKSMGDAKGVLEMMARIRNESGLDSNSLDELWVRSERYSELQAEIDEITSIG